MSSSATLSAVLSAAGRAPSVLDYHDAAVARVSLEGAAAAKAGRSLLTCPYLEGGPIAAVWVEGYRRYLANNEAARLRLHADAIEAEAPARVPVPAAPGLHYEAGSPADARELLSALAAFIKQRPGFDAANYDGARSAWFADTKRAVRDRAAALEVLVRLQADARRGLLRFDPEHVKEANAAGAGRLTVKREASGAWSCDYCTGQYFPVEYRRAALAWLQAFEKAAGRHWEA